MKINNLPEYARDYNWIVARIVDGEAWFYGAYNDEGKAFAVGTEVNGVVVSTTQVMLERSGEHEEIRT